MSKNHQDAGQVVQEIISSAASLATHIQPFWDEDKGRDISKESLSALKRISRELDEIGFEETGE